jgi:hypothetical protein
VGQPASHDQGPVMTGKPQPETAASAIPSAADPVEKPAHTRNLAARSETQKFPPGGARVGRARCRLAATPRPGADAPYGRVTGRFHETQRRHAFSGGRCPNARLLHSELRCDAYPLLTRQTKGPSRFRLSPSFSWWSQPGSNR